MTNEESLKEAAKVEEPEEEEEEEMGLLVHALSAENHQETINIQGEAKGKTLITRFRHREHSQLHRYQYRVLLENARRRIQRRPACDYIRRVVYDPGNRLAKKLMGLSPLITTITQ